MSDTRAGTATELNDPLAIEIANIRKSRGLNGALDLPDLVSESWKRCLSDYNLLPDSIPRAEVLSHSELRPILEEREDFLRIAEPEIERLFQRLVDSEYLVSLASSQGAMLLFRCDYQYLGELAGSGVIPGSIWTEDRQGTNGIGTCLRVGKSVSVVGTEHYGAATQDLTCLTAPVCGRKGAIECVINVTTARSADIRMNRVVQSIVERAARRIENGHFGRLHRRNLMLRILDNAENSDMAEEGQIAISESGLILEGTSQVARLLKQPVDELIGTSATELFELDTDLSEIRPGTPIMLQYGGKTLRAMLSVPETRRQSAALQTGSARMSPATPWALKTVDLVKEDLRINPVLSQAMDRAQRLLSSGLPVVVTGETGAGKTSFAKAVARHCFGEDTKIVFVDCAALEARSNLSSLFENRLQGQRSCLIIDRIDEMSEAHQSVLLGLLESDRQAAVNGIGMIVISTQELSELVKESRLRPDLLHRLKGGQIALPPLRNAPDIELTVRDLFRIERELQEKPDLELDDDVRLVLQHYHWPGNLRELRNSLRHAIALSDGKLVRLDQLPQDIVEEIARKDLTARSQSEASKIEAALRYNGGNVSLTARYLGMSRATLYRKIQIQKAREET